MIRIPGINYFVVLSVFAFVFINNAKAEEKPAFNRTVLMQNQVNLAKPDVKVKTIRVVFPPAYKTPWHTHDGPGPRYVVKGELKVTEAGKTQIYRAGDVFWESGKLMAVENVSMQTSELIIVELAPAKDH